MTELQAPWREPKLVTALLDQAVARYPERPALDFLGRKWSYAQVADLVRRAARGLQDRGLGPGDRFGLCLPNTPYFVILYFAALRIGATVVNFNPLYTEPELDHQARDAGVRMMAVPDLRMIHAKVAAVADGAGIETIVVCPMAGILPLAQSIGFRLFKRREQAQVPADARHVRFADIVSRDAEPSPVAVSIDDVAVLQYTGGTTGVPKGAMLTHANLYANATQMQAHVGSHHEARDVVIGVLPMFHVFALTAVLNFSIENAAEIVLLPRFDLKQLVRTVRRTKPSQFFGVPTIYVALNDIPGERLPGFETLCHSVSGGAPLPLEVRETFERRTGCPVLEGYGLSESSPIITTQPLDGPIKANSCGIAMPDTIIEIRDLDDPSRLLQQGERGEVCVRGPQVMKGYWRNLEATAATFVDGALRTGDVGYLDADGYLFLVDRIKDLILCGGYNVYPRTIEDAVYHHPAVKEAIAIGVPDSYRGQAPKLFVALVDGAAASPEELLAFLARSLNKIEMPREIEIRSSLPKTLIGKLSRKELVAEERARAGAAG